MHNSSTQDFLSPSEELYQTILKPAAHGPENLSHETNTKSIFSV